MANNSPFTASSKDLLHNYIAGNKNDPGKPQPAVNWNDVNAPAYADPIGKKPTNTGSGVDAITSAAPTINPITGNVSVPGTSSVDSSAPTVDATNANAVVKAVADANAVPTMSPKFAQQQLERSPMNATLASTSAVAGGPPTMASDSSSSSKDKGSFLGNLAKKIFGDQTFGQRMRSFAYGVAGNPQLGPAYTQQIQSNLLQQMMKQNEYNMQMSKTNEYYNNLLAQQTNPLAIKNIMAQRDAEIQKIAAQQAANEAYFRDTYAMQVGLANAGGMRYGAGGVQGQ